MRKSNPMDLKPMLPQALENELQLIFKSITWFISLLLSHPKQNGLGLLEKTVSIYECYVLSDSLNRPFFPFLLCSPFLTNCANISCFIEIGEILLWSSSKHSFQRTILLGEIDPDILECDVFVCVLSDNCRNSWNNRIKRNARITGRPTAQNFLFWLYFA